MIGKSYGKVFFETVAKYFFGFTWAVKQMSLPYLVSMTFY